MPSLTITIALTELDTAALTEWAAGDVQGTVAGICTRAIAERKQNWAAVEMSKGNPSGAPGTLEGLAGAYVAREAAEAEARAKVQAAAEAQRSAETAPQDAATKAKAQPLTKRAP